jgi:hypothetical protein
MADPAAMVGGMALGHVFPEVVPKPLMYLIAIAAVAYLFRVQIRRFLR